MTTAEWVVILESSARPSHGEMDESDVEWLLEGLGDLQPVALYSPERYAVQMRIHASGQPQALQIGMDRWRLAVERLGKGSGPLFRAEVLTLEEYEVDCRIAFERDGDDGTATPAGLECDRPGDGLLWQVFHDPLTHLPAPGLFMNHLELALLRGPVDGAVQALLVVKLLGLDTVNQRWGRSAGDEVLVVAARRLRAALPSTQAVGRIRGEEFVTLVEAPSPRAAVAVAEAVVASLGAAIQIGDVEVSVLVGAGITHAREHHDAEELLAEATAALRLSEQSGRVEVNRVGLPLAGAAVTSLSANHDPLGYVLLLQRAAMAANESSSLTRAAGLVVGHVCAHLGWPFGHMYVVGPDGELRPGQLSRPRSGLNQPLLDVLDHTTLPPAGGSLAARVAQTGQPAWVSDITTEPPSPWTRIADECGLDAAVAFPVLVGREVVAVLQFLTPEAQPPDDAFVEILRCVGSQLGRVVERQRSEESRRSSEDRLREAHSLAQIGSWYVEPVTGAAAWSEGMSEILGVGPDVPHTNEFFMELVHAEDRHRVEAATALARATGGSGPVEFRVIRPDGRLRWVCARTNSPSDDAGDVASVYGTIIDITDVKAAKASLRERECQLSMAEEIAGLGFWVRDLVERRIEWSDGMYLLWGVDRSTFEPTLEAIHSYIHPDDRDFVHQELTMMMGGTGRAEFRATPPDGRQRWFRGHAVAIFDDHGRPARIVGTLQDVMSERRAQQELWSSYQPYRSIVDTTVRRMWVIDADD